MHQLPAFANMTMSVRRDLCSVMVFEVVEQAGTVVLHNKQEVWLDKWHKATEVTVKVQKKYWEFWKWCYEFKGSGIILSRNEILQWF